MIKPMLAMGRDKVTITNWNDWAIEQKFDGWRIIAEVTADGRVRAYTRPRRRADGGKTMELVQLPDLSAGHLPLYLATAFGHLPAGIYDGELLGGKTSTDVGSRKYQDALRFVVFDVLAHGTADLTTCPYFGRRKVLEDTFRGLNVAPTLTLAQSVNVTCEDDVKKLFEHVRNEGGEGLMAKRKNATYQPGKRSRDLVKLKNLEVVVCTVIGFEASRGTVLKRGQFATVILEDANGNPTSVKTVDDEELAAFNAQATPAWERTRRPLDTSKYAKKIAAKFRHAVTGTHPAIGRELRIEFQDFTPTAGYRHPRWDRWETE